LNLRRPNISANKTDLADLLALQIRAMHLPAPVREYQALEGRKFRCDLAWLEAKVFAEVQGGEYMQGRHSRANGMAADDEKWNLLTLAGWRGFYFTGSQVRSGAAIDFLTKVFHAL
jgi:hypothetical protein